MLRSKLPRHNPQQPNADNSGWPMAAAAVPYDHLPTEIGYDVTPTDIQSTILPFDGAAQFFYV